MNESWMGTAITAAVTFVSGLITAAIVWMARVRISKVNAEAPVSEVIMKWAEEIKEERDAQKKEIESLRESQHKLHATVMHNAENIAKLEYRETKCQEELKATRKELDATRKLATRAERKAEDACIVATESVKAIQKVERKMNGHRESEGKP